MKLDTQRCTWNSQERIANVWLHNKTNILEKEYKEANMQYSKSNVANEHAEMVHEWAQKGFTSEYDLFITRSVLQ